MATNVPNKIVATATAAAAASAAASDAATRRMNSGARDGRALRVRFFLAAMTILLVATAIVAVGVGSAQISAETVVRVLLWNALPVGWIDLSGISEPDRIVVWLVRTPRVLVAALVGASLAVAGAQMQGLFRNALASPDVVGTSAGGAFGAVLALATGLAMRSIFYLPLLSFVGALAALFAVYAIATRRGRTPVATLLLAGIALNALIGAASSFLISMKWVRYEVAQEILFWLMGGLDNRTWDHFWLILPPTAVGLIVAAVYARDLDVLALGEETAAAIGADVEKIKRVLMTSAALLTGGSVAVAGTVGFVGLIIPHIVRLVIGPRHKYLLPASALTGATFLIAADILARTLQRPEEIRLGIITAVFGAPFFLYLLLREQKAVGTV